MEGNQIKKYLLYASGEILLVVIGILIALQINNWNVTQTEKKEEIAILEGIVDNIMLDTIDINLNMRLYQRQIRNDSALFAHLALQKPYNDTVAAQLTSTLFSSVLLVLHQSYFQEAKLRGLKIISNPDLRSKISRLYEFDYNYLLYIENNVNNEFLTSLIEIANANLYLEYKMDPDESRAVIPYIAPEKYEQLLANKSFHLMVGAVNSYKNQMLYDRYIPVRQKALELVTDIRKELEKLK